MRVVVGVMLVLGLMVGSVRAQLELPEGYGDTVDVYLTGAGAEAAGVHGEHTLTWDAGLAAYVEDPGEFAEKNVLFGVQEGEFTEWDDWNVIVLWEYGEFGVYSWVGSWNGGNGQFSGFLDLMTMEPVTEWSGAWTQEVGVVGGVISAAGLVSSAGGTMEALLYVVIPLVFSIFGVIVGYFLVLRIIRSCGK